jgi:hypothetical protein
MTMDWKSEQPQEFLELLERVDSLPAALRGELRPLCDRLGHIIRLQKRLVRISRDAADKLQLDVKYLLFDLDATRRERNLLREELREQSEGLG